MENMRLTEATAQRVKELLDKKGWKQYDLYKNGGIPRSTISNVINMKKKRVSSDTVYQICTTLGIKIKDFYDAPIFDEVDD